MRRVVTWDLAGWGEIAHALDVCERTARRYSTQSEDPLPVYRFRRRVRARSVELAAWVVRQQDVGPAYTPSRDDRAGEQMDSNPD